MANQRDETLDLDLIVSAQGSCGARAASIQAGEIHNAPLPSGPTGSCPLEPLSSEKVYLYPEECYEEIEECLMASAFEGKLFRDSKPNSSKVVAYVKSLINSKMMIKVINGTHYTGSFYCMDKQGNIILEDAVEYTECSTSKTDSPSLESQYVGVKLIPITTQESVHVQSANHIPSTTQESIHVESPNYIPITSQESVHVESPNYIPITSQESVHVESPN